MCVLQSFLIYCSSENLTNFSKNDNNLYIPGRCFLFIIIGNVNNFFLNCLVPEDTFMSNKYSLLHISNNHLNSEKF